MKTVEEATEDFSLCALMDYEAEKELNGEVDIEEFLYECFKGGIEFAQRWIPVEEDLPISQGHYFVKCKTSFPKNCDVVVAEFYEDNNTFYSESGDHPIKDATHWRPIELK